MKKWWSANFNWFARRIAPGGRLRLFFRSPNGTENARVTIVHDQAHPSVLEVAIRR